MRRVRLTHAAFVGLTALALWACGDTTGAAACVPGASVECVCSSGASGAQTCNANGTGYDPCVCQDGSGQDDTGSQGNPQEATDTTTGPEVPAAGELIAVEPGGDSICARGTPFRFFVRGGDPTKVVIDFLGGGACWNTFSCEVGAQINGQPIFTDAAETLEELEAGLDAGMLGGIYDFENPDNPYYGWTFIRVPYCSADFYWGDETVDYTEELTIHHKGYINAKAVTAWVTAHYPEAEQVVATGCEAGAYGSLNQAISLAASYPDATITALGDSGAGIITDSFFADAFMTWNAFASMPLHLEGLAGKDLEDITVTDFVVAAANGNPSMRVAQYTTAHDMLQSYHYMFMGGDVSQWPVQARASLVHIRARADNFRYYLANGPVHCITPYDIAYDRATNGVNFMSWLKDLSQDGMLPDDVVCEGECREDGICDGCIEGSIESVACGWCEGWEP